jgi:hypothetical protein
LKYVPKKGEPSKVAEGLEETVVMWIPCKVFLAPNARAGELIHLGKYLTGVQAGGWKDGSEDGAGQVRSPSAGDLDSLCKGVMPPGQEGQAFLCLAVGSDNPTNAGRLLCRFLRAFIPHPVIAIHPEPHLPLNSCAAGCPGD